MSESTSEAAKKQKRMEQPDQNKNQLAVAGPSNASLPPIYKLDNDCMDEIFEYLSLQDLHSFGQTCKRMQKWAGEYFKRNFASAEKFTHDNGIHTVYSDHKGVNNQRTQTSGFNRFLTYTSYYYHSSGPLRYLEMHSDEFVSLNELYIVCTNISPENVKYLRKLLARTEIVRLHQCSLWGDFYEIFLKFCKNLKNLTIIDDLGYILHQHRNPWLNREYPKLESVYFDPRRAKPIGDLGRFLQRNPSVRNFTANSKFLWVNGQSLLESATKLDELCIRNVENRYGDTIMRDVSAICQLLKQLYEREFYKRLHFETDRFNQEYSNHLSSLNGLDRLTIRQLDGIFDLPNFVNLKRLSIGGQLASRDIEMLASNLVNLEHLTLGALTGNDISRVVSRLPKLEKFHVHPSEGVLNLLKLNEQREQLLFACKVRIYVSQEVFMATKWTAKNGDINMEFIEMRRNCAV